MMLCLACRRVSPADSRFCGFCARTLNGFQCDGGHWTPSLDVAACTSCGSPVLSDGARGLRLAPLARVLSLLLAIAVWKVILLPHLGTVLAGTGNAALWTVAFLTNSCPACLRALFSQCLSWVVALWIVGHFLRFTPGGGGSVGVWLRGLPLLLLRRAYHLITDSLRLLAHGVRRLVWPPTKRP